MDSFRIKVFRVLASHLNLRRAGRDLCLSRQCVTQHVKALEDELGTPLFARNGHGIELTAGGQALLSYAERIESLCSAAQAAVSNASGLHPRTLALGAATNIAQYLLPRLIVAFAGKNPYISIKAMSGNTDSVLDALSNHRIDLALIERPAEYDGIEVETFLLDSLVLAVPANHEWADSVIDVSMLKGDPFLICEVGSGARRSVETTLARAGFSREDLSVVMELDSTEGILSAVEAGLGVAIISRRAVHNRIRPGGVRIARVRGMRLSSSFLIDNRTGEIQTSPVAAFRSFLLSKIQTLIESKVYPFPRGPKDTTADVVPIHVRAAPRM